MNNLRHGLILLVMTVIITPVMAAKPNPYLAPDDTLISISGAVRSVAPDSFVLDYGEGIITVAVDDMAYIPLNELAFQMCWKDGGP